MQHGKQLHVRSKKKEERKASHSPRDEIFGTQNRLQELVHTETEAKHGGEIFHGSYLGMRYASVSISGPGRQTGGRPQLARPGGPCAREAVQFP